MAGEREITAEELAGIVSDGLESADATRARGLTDLLDVRLARLEGLRRELELRRNVDDSDPRLGVLQERLAATEVTVRALDLEALRAITPPAEAADDEATVSGRVVLPAGEVPDDARARLRDKGGNLVRGVEGRLDEGGAFNLKVPISGKGQDAGSEYTVVIVDKNDKEIARDDRAVLPAKGTVEYRELPLKASRVVEAAAVVAAATAATTGTGAVAGTGRAAAGTRRAAGTKPVTAGGAKPAGGGRTGRTTTSGPTPASAAGSPMPATPKPATPKPKPTARTTVGRSGGPGRAAGTRRRTTPN